MNYLVISFSILVIQNMVYYVLIEWMVGNPKVRNWNEYLQLYTVLSCHNMLIIFRGGMIVFGIANLIP